MLACRQRKKRKQVTLRSFDHTAPAVVRYYSMFMILSGALCHAPESAFGDAYLCPFYCFGEKKRTLKGRVRAFLRAKSVYYPEGEVTQGECRNIEKSFVPFSRVWHVEQCSIFHFSPFGLGCFGHAVVLFCFYGASRHTRQ